jgi:hypothetical protein
MKIKTKIQFLAVPLKKERKQAKFKLMNTGLAAIIILLSAYYIFSVNDLSVKGYVLFSAKTKLMGIKENNDRLQWQVAALRSSQNIVERAAKLGLVEVGEVKFIEARSDQVAIREP